MNLLSHEIRNGNEIAFREFFNKTYPRVRAYLEKVFERDNLHLDDHAQEVYIKLWQNRAQLDENQSIEGYLFRILRNTVISHFRTAARKNKQAASHLELVVARDEGHNDVVDDINKKDYTLHYEKIMLEINPLKRQCFRLHREYGLTYMEISRREGIAVKTVEKYIRETARILRTRLLPAIRCYIIALYFLQ